MTQHAARRRDDLTPTLVEFIGGARQALAIATQQLGHRPIVDAVLAQRRRRRELRIRVLGEYDYLREDIVPRDPWQAGGDNEDNRRALMALLRGGIHARLDNDSDLFHSNFVVRDPTTSNAAVLLTSANLDAGGMERHWESLVVVQNRPIARAFMEEFQASWEGYRPVRRDEPQVSRAGGTAVKAVFAPRHQPEMEVMKQIERARAKVRFAIYTFSTQSGIDEALLAAHARGVDVAGVVDQQQRGQRWSVEATLRAAGIRVRTVGSATRKLHHKLVSVDDKVTMLGTFNFSASAKLSHETILVLGDARASSPTQRSIAAAVAAEIDRLLALPG